MELKNLKIKIIKEQSKSIQRSTPTLLTLCGQICALTGDKSGACEGFNKAKTNGDKQADNYLEQYCGNLNKW